MSNKSNSSGSNLNTDITWNNELVFKWISEIIEQSTRHGALAKLNKVRDLIPDLGPWLWDSFGTISAMLQEITRAYPCLTPSLTDHQIYKLCNVVALLQNVAEHAATRSSFLQAEIPIYLLPFLKFAPDDSNFEYLQVVTLGVIGAIVKHETQESINYLLKIELMPYCLKFIQSGTELRKLMSLFVVFKIVKNDVGLAYVCGTYDRFSQLAMVFGKLVFSLARQPSARVFKLVLKCYLQLTNHKKAREALKECLPDPMKDLSFVEFVRGDDESKNMLRQLHGILEIGVTRKIHIPVPPKPPKATLSIQECSSKDFLRLEDDKHKK